MRASNSRSTGAQQGAGAAAILILIAGWILLAWPWLSGRVAIPYDAKGQFLPQLQFMAASWARGDSAAWAPYVFAGHPQVADPQSLIFSPPFAALAWLNPSPSAWAADATLYATILAGAAAMLVWLSDKGLHRAAGLLAALSFAFGAAMAWRIQHVGQVLSLAYLPIVFLCLDRAIDRRSIVWGAVAGLAAACLVLGRDQVALLSVYLLIGYVASRLVFEVDDWRRSTRAAMAPLSAATLVGAVVIALPILMTALVAADSNRPQIDYEGAARGSLHPASLLTLFAADAFGASGHTGEFWGPPSRLWSDTGLYLAQNMGQLYLGALPALLVVWGAASGALWRRGVRVFAIAFLIMVVYALGWHTPGFRLMHVALPGVDFFRRPADAVYLIGFLASVLSGVAAHAVLTDRPELRRRPMIVAAGVVSVALSILAGLAHRFDMLDIAWPAIAISAALFALSAVAMTVARRFAVGSPAITAFIVAAVLTGDLAWSNRPGGSTGLSPAVFDVLDPASKNETIAVVKSRLAATASDTRRDRAEIVGFDFHWPNVGLTRSIDTTLGYNPLRLGHYARATGAGDSAGLPEQKSFAPLSPSYRGTLAHMLGLSTIATSVPIEQIDQGLKPGDVTLVARTADGYVYDNHGALPRVLFATRALTSDFEALIASGAWPDVDYMTTVLLEAGAPTPQETRRPGTARIAGYRNDRVTLDVDSPDGGWVVLNDVWHPWWFATVDGVSTPLLRANGLFRAVAAPPGRHTIEFTFEPVRGALRQLAGRG
ncbi:MAG: hypothetical protein ACT4OU_06875 [Hyphomicrobium sp.]